MKIFHLVQKMHGSIKVVSDVAFCLKNYAWLWQEDKSTFILIITWNYNLDYSLEFTQYKLSQKIIITVLLSSCWSFNWKLTALTLL